MVYEAVGGPRLGKIENAQLTDFADPYQPGRLLMTRQSDVYISIKTGRT